MCVCERGREREKERVCVCLCVFIEVVVVCGVCERTDITTYHLYLSSHFFSIPCVGGCEVCSIKYVSQGGGSGGECDIGSMEKRTRHRCSGVIMVMFCYFMISYDMLYGML